MNSILHGFLPKFLKFGLVGFSGVIVDFSITYLLKEKLKVQKYLANAIGFCTAASSNYILNRLWTFHSLNPQIGLEYIRFFGVSLIGLGLNTLILWVLTQKYEKNFYLSKIVAIGIVTVWNFFINSIFTF